MEDAVSVAGDDTEPGDGDDAGDNPCAECAATELLLEALIAELGGVGAKKDGGEIGGSCDREHADQQGGRVEPAAELAAGGVADGNAAGSDPANCGPEGERRQHR